MNHSAHSSVYTSTNAYSSTSAGAYYDAVQPYYLCADYASGLYEDPSSSTEERSTDHIGLGACFDADHALFEELLNAEVTSTGRSGPCTVIPMRSPPSYDQETGFLPPPQPFNGSLPYPYAPTSSHSTASPAFDQPLPATTEPCRPPDLVYPPLYRIHDPKDKYSGTTSSQSLRVSHHASYCRPLSSYLSPSPEPSRHISLPDIASQWSNISAHAGCSPVSLSLDQSLPETAPMTCVSPDFIYPSAPCGLEDDHWTDASSQSSRASHRSSSSSPCPSPSPSPSIRTSSIVIASRRRNAPARTAAPVPADTWQCPYCPYVQRNRRSPDLKRHIKTHTRDEAVADWVCCGIPVDASELGVPATTMREAQAFEYDGVLMIGGCRKAFSRRDALKRHLQREKGKCFGDALSLHQRGNRESL